MDKNVIKVEKIIQYMTNQKISKSEFAKQCKTSLKTLNKILNGYLSFDTRILIRICKVMKINIVDLL